MLNVTQATKNSYLQDSGHKEFTISFPNLNPAPLVLNATILRQFHFFTDM